MESSEILLSLLGLTFRIPEISATTALLAVTIVMSLYAETNPIIKDKWMMNPFRVVHRGEYYRLITSGFIHSGYIHLAFNMFVLHSFGNIAEFIMGQILGSIGTLVYVLMYLLALIFSDIPSLIKHRNRDWYNSLGASGAISAIVFFYIMFNPTGKVGFIFIPGLEFPGFILAILYLFYSAYMSRNSNDRIGHDAHLFGALFGIIFSIIIYPQVIPHFIEQISSWEGFF